MNKIISGDDKRWEESQEVIAGCKQADVIDSARVGERCNSDGSSVLVFGERPELVRGAIHVGTGGRTF